MGWIKTEDGEKKWIDERGGKREGAGRKSKGITKKVSLTLSDELWNEINDFDGTVADYIRSLKENNNSNETSSLEHLVFDSDFNINEINDDSVKEMKKVTQFENLQEENKELTKEYAEEYWEIYKRDFLRENEVSDEAIQNVYDSLMRLLFQGKDTIQLETSPRYRSQYSGKWFSSIKNLLKAEIPELITKAESKIKRKQEQIKKKEHDENLKRMSKENLSRGWK